MASVKYPDIIITCYNCMKVCEGVTSEEARRIKFMNEKLWSAGRFGVLYLCEECDDFITGLFKQAGAPRPKED